MVVKVRSGFDKLQFVTIIIRQLDNILNEVQEKEKSEAEKLKRELSKFFYDCESLRIALLTINISDDLKIEAKLPTITYQYLSEFDIVEKDDCLKGKIDNKKKYDLKRFFDGREIKITENLPLELYDINSKCLENEVSSSPEQLSDDLPASTESVETSTNDLLDYLEKAEKEMYTKTSFLRRKKKKSNMFLTSTSTEFDLKEIKGYKPQEKILQDYSTAVYKREKIKGSKVQFIAKLTPKYFEDDLKKSYPKEDPELLKVYVEMCTIIYNKILKNIGYNSYNSFEGETIIEKYGDYFSEKDLCSFFVKVTKIRRNILSAIKNFVKGSNNITTYAEILYEEKVKFIKDKKLIDAKLKEISDYIDKKIGYPDPGDQEGTVSQDKSEGLNVKGRLSTLALKGQGKNLTIWIQNYYEFQEMSKKLMDHSNMGLLTHNTNFVRLCNYLIENYKKKVSKNEDKLDFFTNIKNVLLNEGSVNELSQIISSQILKKNNREDVDYESIINNIFTTYLLNIEVSYKKYMYFCKAFYTVSSMELLSSILKPEELIDLMESLNMKKEIDSKKYSELSSDIKNIEKIKVILDKWITPQPGPAQPDPAQPDPAQSDPESEKSQKRKIIEAWKDDLDNFSTILEKEIEETEKIEGKKTLENYIHNYSKLETRIEITLRQIDILKMVKEKDNKKEIKTLEGLVKRDKSAQKIIGKKLKKYKPWIVFYKQLIPHFDELVKDYNENEEELKKIRGKIDSHKKVARNATGRLYVEYEEFLSNMRGGGKTLHNYTYYNQNYCLLKSKERESIQTIKDTFFKNLEGFCNDINNNTHIKFLYNSSSIWEKIFGGEDTVGWLCPIISEEKISKLFLDCSRKTGLYDALYYPITLCDSFRELEKYNTITKNNKKVKREKIKIQRKFNKARNAINRVWRGRATFWDIFSIVKFFLNKQLQITPSIYYKITNVVKNFIDNYISYGRLNVSLYGIIPRIKKYLEKLSDKRKDKRAKRKVKLEAELAEIKKEIEELEGRLGEDPTAVEYQNTDVKKKLREAKRKRKELQKKKEEAENEGGDEGENEGGNAGGGPVELDVIAPTNPSNVPTELAQHQGTANQPSAPPVDQVSTPGQASGTQQNPLPLPEGVESNVGENGTLIIDISNLQAGMFYSLQDRGFPGLVFQCPDNTITNNITLVPPPEPPRPGENPISQTITQPGTQSETKPEVVGLRDNIDMRIRGDNYMSVTKYIRDLIDKRNLYGLEPKNIDYLEKFKKFFEDDKNLLYEPKVWGFKVMISPQQYEEEIRKIKILSRELEAFKGLMAMIHDSVGLNQIIDFREGSNILRGGAAEADTTTAASTAAATTAATTAATAAADKSIIPVAKPLPIVREEGSVLNEAQQKEKEEKKTEMLENIKKCQGDLLKLLEEYENSAKRLGETRAYKAGKSLGYMGSELAEKTMTYLSEAGKNTAKRLADANKKDGFEGFQDRIRYNVSSPTSVERYVREKMGLDQNGIKITLDVFSDLGVKDIKDIIKNNVTRDDILQRYKITFSDSDNVLTGNLYSDLKAMNDDLKNITKEVRKNEELRAKNPSADSFRKRLDALIPQQEKLKEDIEAEKINVDKQIEDYVEKNYGSKIDGIIRASNEEVEKEKEKEAERERKMAEEDEKARKRLEEKEKKDERDKLLGKKGFFDSFKRDSLNVKIADAKERLEKAREAGLPASDIARIQEEIDSLEKQIDDEKKQKEEKEAEALKAKEKEKKAKEDAENAAAVTAAAKEASENAKTPEEKQIADAQLEKAEEAEAVAKVEQAKAKEEAEAAEAAAAAATAPTADEATAATGEEANAAQEDNLADPIPETPDTPKPSGILKQTTDGFKPGRLGITGTITGDDNDVVEYKKLKGEYNGLVKKYKQYEGGYNNILKYNYKNDGSSMINSFYSKIKNYINNYLYLRDKFIHILERFNVYKDNGSYTGNSIFSSLNKEIKDCEKYIRLCDDIINKLETLKSNISEKYYSKKTKKEEQNDYIKERIEEIEKMSNFKNFDNKNEVREMEFLCSTINSYRYNRLDFMNEPEWNRRLFKGKGICSDFKKRYEEHIRKKKDQEKKKKDDEKKQKEQSDKVKELENKLSKLQKQPTQQPQQSQRQQVQQVQQPQRQQVQQVQQPQRQDKPQIQQMQQRPSQPSPGAPTPGQPRPGKPGAPTPGKPGAPIPGLQMPGLQIPGKKAPGFPGSDKALVPFNADPTGKKPMGLNMGKNIDQKLLEIGKKQGSPLVVPPKEKLTELSKVVNNDKFLDIIRNKKFSEFTDKEIKDVDLVRDRFNSFVNDYYGLLDMFYTYKKNKEKGEKEDIVVLLKQEKQIEELKDIVLEYKTNLEKFKNACEVKVEAVEANSGKEIKDKEKEFKDVFQYMQGLFKEELKEEKKATKENTKILKEENDLQKEKILLLEDKKKSKKTPKKQRKPKAGKKDKKDRTGKKDKKDRTGKKDKKDRTGKKDRKPKKDRTGKKDRKK